MILLFMFGVILCIIGLWIVYPSVEGMADMTSIRLVGLTADSATYVASDGLTNSPAWQPVIGGFTQIAGSLGHLVGVTNNTAMYGVLLEGSITNYSWTPLFGDVVQVSFDYPRVAAITTSGSISHIDDIENKKSFNDIGGSYKWVSIKGGEAYAIGTDNVIYYTQSLLSPSWKNVSSTIAGKRFTQVAFDGADVAVVDSR